MTRGQFLTVLTLGAACAIGLASAAIAALVLLSTSTYLGLIYALHGAADGISRGWLAALIVGGGIGAAVGLVKAQQAVVSWQVGRELAALKREIRDVEMALGTDKALKYAAYKSRQLFDQARGTNVDLFGARNLSTAEDEMRGLLQDSETT